MDTQQKGRAALVDVKCNVHQSVCPPPLSVSSFHTETVVLDIVFVVTVHVSQAATISQLLPTEYS